MLFQSSIRRELARSFGATLVVLITIVMTIVLIRTLGQASRGAIDPQDVMLFMAFSAMGRLPTILSLSLFIAMVSTLSRMYRESEMVVWFTSGQGLWGFLRPLFRFAWPVLLIIGLMSMFVWPWANQQTQDMRERYASRGDLDRIAPGQFQESSNGNRVFFIDGGNAEAKQSSNNVFISATNQGRNTVITANAGRIEMRGEEQLLLLENGQRVETTDGKNALKISEFQEYGTKTGGTNSLAADALEAKLLSTRELLKSPTNINRSELAWRLGLLLSAINMVVLAVALASVNPRGGRSGNMIFVLLTFVIYNNLLNLGQTWIYNGMVSVSAFLLLLHGGVLLLGLTWLAKRHSNWTLRSVFALNRGRTAPTKTPL